MPQNLKVIYTTGVPIVADFNATDGPPIICDQNTGILYGLAGGAVVAVFTPCMQVDTGITATGTTQSDAYSVTDGIAYFGTVASGTGARIDLSTAGTWSTVYNGGANPLKVYPATGVKINQLAANAPMLLSINTGCRFEVVSSTQIIGILSA